MSGFIAPKTTKPNSLTPSFTDKIDRQYIGRKD